MNFMSAATHRRLVPTVLLVLGMAGSAPAQSIGTKQTSARDGVYTKKQSNRGDAIYRKDCVSCHGAAFEGGESAPGLADGTFKANWNGLTVGDLFERIQETMPPDDPGKLTRKEIADVLARMLSANEMPAGDNELADRPEMLRLILFDPFKK